MSGGPLDPERLLDDLRRLDCRGGLWVAYSGGADSTALLLALAELRERLPGPLRVAHVNHGQHPDAQRWQAHCAERCADLDIPLASLAIDPQGVPGASPEAEWRQRRYAALATLLGPGEDLLTAHHREDQAETVLLALLRGSGPAGLAGMPKARPLGAGRLLRPLLEVPQAALHAFLRERNCAWLDDSSNRDTARDRNFLRHEVLPVLRQRWPSCAASLARSARHNAEALAGLERLAATQLHRRQRSPRILALDGLQEDTAMLKLVVRQWLRGAGAPPMPRARLEELARQARAARSDAGVAVAWEAWRLRLWDGHLWLDDQSPPAACPARQWREGRDLELGGRLGRLRLGRPPAGHGLTVRARAAADTVILAGGHHTPVKELLRRARVPPWMRAAVPLLEDRGEIRAIGDWTFDRTFGQWLRAQGADLLWEPADPTLRWVRDRCHATPVATGRPLG